MRTHAILSTLLLGATALAASSTARAGVYVEEIQTMSGMGQSQSSTVKTWIEGDTMLVEDPRLGGTLLIINTRKNTLTGLDPKAKTFWQIKDSDMQAFGQGMGDMQKFGVQKGGDGSLQVPEGIFEKTGKKREIEGLEGGKKVKWTAYEVKVRDVKMPQAQGAALASTMWFANVKDYDPAVQRNRLRMFMGDGAGADAFLKQWDALDGVPVVTENKINTPQGSVEIRQELKKVARQKVTPEQLTVPKTFKQVEDPITQIKRMYPQGIPMPGAQGAGGPPPMAPLPGGPAPR